VGAPIRVLISGVFSHGALGATYATAFERLGCEVVRFDYDAAYFSNPLSRNRLVRRLVRRRLWDEMNALTIRAVQDVRPALVLAIKASYLDGESVSHLRASLGIPVVNYYADNPYCGIPLDPRKTSAQRRDLVDVLRAYSAVFIWGRAIANRLQADGVQSSYLPFAADFATYRPPTNPGAMTGCSECDGQHDIVFVGQHNAKRGQHVDAIRRHVVSLWGPRWDRLSRSGRVRHRVHRKPAWGSFSSDLYGNAKVSLNVVDDLNMPGHNMRTFEVPASGGVMLAHHTQEQEEFFPEGEAAFYYRTPQELDSKLDTILHDPGRRAAVAKNALRIAQQNTYLHRAADLLKACGLRAASVAGVGAGS